MLRIIEIGKNPKTKKHKAVIKRARKIRKRTIKRAKNCVVKKIIRVRKNPKVQRIKHQTKIVGFLRNTKKHNRLYYTGTGFSKDKSSAKIFPGDAAKFEAKRILPMLPGKIYGIQVEKA